MPRVGEISINRQGGFWERNNEQREKWNWCECNGMRNEEERDMGLVKNEIK